MLFILCKVDTVRITGASTPETIQQHHLSIKPRMNPNKIIPESKQKNKPLNFPPIPTPKIIPEIFILLNSPKPTLNTIPQPESHTNKIQPQTLKSRLIPPYPSNQKNRLIFTGF